MAYQSAIKQGPTKGGIGLGGLVSTAVGAVTGNPAMIAAGLTSGTPLGQAIGIANSLSSGGGKEASPSSYTESNFQMPELGSQAPEIYQADAPNLGGDAMSRALSSKESSPDFLVHQALSDLKNPDVANSMPYDTYMQVVNPLLQYKHYGVGGPPKGN